MIDDRTYTHLDVLTRGVAEGWADPRTDPRDISVEEWLRRQQSALIWFDLVAGRPVRPGPSTGIRYGRGELGQWGPATCADALVFASTRDGRRWIVMGERDDGHGWALPGGHADPGETSQQTAARELCEETGLRLPGAVWHQHEPVVVPDPRSTDEAWTETVLLSTDLGVFPGVGDMPAPVGGSDMRRAAWVRADSYGVLVGDIAARFNGQVFGAHRDMLAEVLDGGERR